MIASIRSLRTPGPAADWLGFCLFGRMLTWCHVRSSRRAGREIAGVRRHGARRRPTRAAFTIETDIPGARRPRARAGQPVAEPARGGADPCGQTRSCGAPVVSVVRSTRLVREGAVRQMLRARTRMPAEAALALPDWAARRAGEQARAHARAIAATNCTVIGDLDALWREQAPSCPTVPGHDHIRSTAAAEALAGMLLAATGHRGPPRGGLYRRGSAASARRLQVGRITAQVGIEPARRPGCPAMPRLRRVLRRV